MGGAIGMSLPRLSLTTSSVTASWGWGDELTIRPSRRLELSPDPLGYENPSMGGGGTRKLLPSSAPPPPPPSSRRREAGMGVRTRAYAENRVLIPSTESPPPLPQARPFCPDPCPGRALPHLQAPLAPRRAPREESFSRLRAPWLWGRWRAGWSGRQWV